MNPLDDLPPDSRTEVVAAVRQAWPRLESDAEAEEIIRCSEPLWNALEDRGGVDTWAVGSSAACSLRHSPCIRRATRDSPVEVAVAARRLGQLD